MGNTGTQDKAVLPYFSVMTYGAIGNGIVDDTAAIQSAIAAAQSSSGILYFPPGNYKTSSPLAVTTPISIEAAGQESVTITPTGAVTTSVLNIDLAAAAAVPIRGGFTINMAATPAGTVGVNFNNVAGTTNISDIVIVNGTGIGLQLTNSSNDHFFHCSIQGGQKGISVDGDNCAELYWTEIDINNPAGNTMEAYLEVDRALATDIGGHYLQFVRGTNAGTVNNGFLFTNTSGGVDLSPLMMRGCITDDVNGTGSAVSIAQKHDVMMLGHWATSGGASPCVVLNGCQNVTIAGCGYLSAAAGAIVIDLQNACSNVIIDDVVLDGGAGTVGIGLNVGNTQTGIQVGNVACIPTTFTNNFTMLGNAGGQTYGTGRTIVTSATGGAPQSFNLQDGAGAGNKPIRIGGSGDFEMLNTAFSALVLQIFDSGQLCVPDGLSPGNGAIVTANRLWQGPGAPAGALGAIGDTYFRTDTPTTANQRIYVKTAAATWAGVV